MRLPQQSFPAPPRLAGNAVFPPIPASTEALAPAPPVSAVGPVPSAGSLAIRGALTCAVASAALGLHPGRVPVTPVVSKAEGEAVLLGPEVDGSVPDWPGVGPGVGPVPLGTRLPEGSFVPGVPTFDGKLKD